MKWLVTAFEPFGGASTNSSQVLLERLRQLDWRKRLQFHSPVPVEFAKAWNNIREVIENSGDIAGVLALGQAETRSRISLERVALNWNDARLADNANQRPEQAPICPGSADMHWCNIPWEDFPLTKYTERSYSAGTFVCNNVMFQALEWALPLKKKAGFVHIPVLSSQKDPLFASSPKLDDEVAIEEIVRILEFVLNL